jgi:hypothetical protein
MPREIASLRSQRQVAKRTRSGTSICRKKFRPYALAIGEATLPWNDLHVELGMLFLTVSGGGYANYFFELWNSLTNDGAKRNILTAGAKASLNPALERD